MLKKLKFGITVFVFLAVTTMLLGELDRLLDFSLFARTLLFLTIVFVSFAGGYLVVYHTDGNRIVRSLRL